VLSLMSWPAGTSFKMFEVSFLIVCLWVRR
jgi:hypothetical protein